MNAKEMLMKAVQCDNAGRILEAQNYYQDGIQILKDIFCDQTDLAKKKLYREKIKEYIDREEQIKIRIQKRMETSEVVANIPINENSTGQSYMSLFGKFLTSDVNEILLDEPHLRKRYQFQNLIAFFELSVKRCSNLKFIRLLTKTDEENPKGQMAIFKEIKDDLAQRKITLSIKFEPSLHDRIIVLSSGYIIKIGRGLHIFKATNPLYSLGLCDYEFRKCLQTVVDIWSTKHFS